MTSQLKLSNRFLQIIRQGSIKTIYDALVELITNSDDSYQGLRQKDKYFSITKKDKSITIVDAAAGMTSDQMKSNLLTVGSHSDDFSARGMMGRGAKDCSVLGDITFTSIKNDKISQVTIYQNTSTEISITDAEATDDLRSRYEIKDNGTHVELKANLDIDLEALKNNIYLRNIFQNSDDRCLLNGKQIIYTPPKRKLLMSLDYDIPDYETTAHLEIYRSDVKLPIPKSDDQRQYGIIVSSGLAIYECSALYYSDPTVQNLLWNQNIQYISGVLTCDAINSLAFDATNGKLSAKNPFLILDSNRRNGLDPTHPFTQQLYSHGYEMLKIILNRIQDITDDNLVDTTDIKSIFDGLNDLISSILPIENTLYSWRTKSDTQALLDLSRVVKNVIIDADFMGIDFKSVEDLKEKKFLVKEDISTKNEIKISFSDDPEINTPYQILYMIGYVSIKINIRDISIKKYLSIVDGKLNISDHELALMGIGHILIDAMNNLIIRNKILTGQMSVLTINGLNEYNYNSDEVRKTTSNMIYKFIDNNVTLK